MKLQKSLRRGALLLRNDVISEYKSWLNYGLVILGVILIFSIVDIYSTRYDLGVPLKSIVEILFPGFVLVGGFISSSMLFSDVNNKAENALYLTLPGSRLEKYLVKSLVGSIGYLAFAVIAFFLSTVITGGFTKLIFGLSHPAFNPGDFTTIYWIYLAVQPVFTVGSIVFKKVAFFKTIMVYSAVNLALLVLFLIFARILGLVDSMFYFDLDMSYVFSDFTPETRVLWAKISAVLFGLFFHVVGYFKLTEKEV